MSKALFSDQRELTLAPRKSKTIRWSCGRCHIEADVAQIDAPIADVRDSIARGHQRLSRACDDKHRLRHVRVAVDGITYRFGAYGASQPSQPKAPHAEP